MAVVFSSCSKAIAENFWHRGQSEIIHLSKQNYFLSSWPSVHENQELPLLANTDGKSNSSGVIEAHWPKRGLLQLCISPRRRIYLDFSPNTIDTAERPQALLVDRGINSKHLKRASLSPLNLRPNIDKCKSIKSHLPFGQTRKNCTLTTMKTWNWGKPFFLKIPQISSSQISLKSQIYRQLLSTLFRSKARKSVYIFSKQENY